MSKFDKLPEKITERKTGGTSKFIEAPGKITATLGTGDNAKNSLVYLTLKYCFLIGGALTFLVVVNYWAFRENEKVPDFIGDVKVVWEIMVPIITLALGYAFGKAQK